MSNTKVMCSHISTMNWMQSKTGAKRYAAMISTALPHPFVTSGNRRMAARLSSVVRWVYWRETARSCAVMVGSVAVAAIEVK